MSVYTHKTSAFAGGFRSDLGALEPAGVKAKITWYKRSVAKRYRAMTPDRVADAMDDGNLYISTKVDGELWFLCKLGGEVAFCAPNGRVLEGGVAVCAEAERMLAKAGDILVAGELFAVVRDGRSRCGTVASALADASLAPTLGFKAFDLVSEDGVDAWQTPYEKRLARMTELFGEGRRVGVITTVEGQKDAVLAKYDEWVASGRFEGLVVRGEQGAIWKVKPALDLDVVVLGFGEHRAAGTADIRELIVGLIRDDGRFQVLGTVANGLSDSDRIAWLRRLEPLVVPSSFRMANSEGTLCRFVRPEIVLEVRCTDLLDSDGRDAAIRRMVLAYDRDTGWAPEGIHPFVALLHPVVMRERPDKPIEPAYVGMAQITALLPFTEEAATVATPAASRSEVLHRRVWTKAGKGGTAVRKVVLVATHKGGEGADWPEFCAVFTDYSAGRKEPLQTTVRVASTRGSIDAAVQEWIADNVKKGWDER